jgi:hypothetical protein
MSDDDDNLTPKSLFDTAPITIEEELLYWLRDWVADEELIKWFRENPTSDFVKWLETNKENAIEALYQAKLDQSK